MNPYNIIRSVFRFTVNDDNVLAFLDDPALFSFFDSEFNQIVNHVKRINFVAIDSSHQTKRFSQFILKTKSVDLSFWSVFGHQSHSFS